MRSTAVGATIVMPCAAAQAVTDISSECHLYPATSRRSNFPRPTRFPPRVAAMPTGVGVVGPFEWSTKVSGQVNSMARGVDDRRRMPDVSVGS